MNVNFAKQPQSSSLSELQRENQQLKEELVENRKIASLKISALESCIAELEDGIAQREDLIERLQATYSAKGEESVQVVELPLELNEVTTQSIVREVPVYIEREIVR